MDDLTTATYVLAGVTAGLVAATIALVYFTRSLARVENRRDRIARLSRLIKVGEYIASVEPDMMGFYLTRSSPTEMIASAADREASAVRDLRELMPKKGKGDQFTFAVNDVVHMIDQELPQGGYGSAGALPELDKQMNAIKLRLRKYQLPEWREERRVLYAS